MVSKTISSRIKTCAESRTVSLFAVASAIIQNVPLSVKVWVVEISFPVFWVNVVSFKNSFNDALTEDIAEIETAWFLARIPVLEGSVISTTNPSS